MIRTRRPHRLLADWIQTVFCYGMAFWASWTYGTDHSHKWTHYVWLALMVMWSFYGYWAFERIWKRFRNGEAA